MRATMDSPVNQDTKSYMKSEFPDSEHDRELLKSETTIMDLPEVKDIPGQENITVMPLGELADTTISSADEEGAGLLDFGDDDEDDIEDDDDFDDEVLTGVDEDNSVVIDTGDDEDFDTDDDDILADDEDLDEDDDLDEEDDDEDDFPSASASNVADDDNIKDDMFSGDDTLDDESIDADITSEEIELLDQGGPVERDSDSDNLMRSKLDDTDMEGEPLNEISTGTSLDGSDLDSADLDNADPTKEALGQNDEENSVYSVADTD
ncbi:MAG: hypothetical protein V4717_17570 [Bacteroidota bacterium]